MINMVDQQPLSTGIKEITLLHDNAPANKADALFRNRLFWRRTELGFNSESSILQSRPYILFFFKFNYNVYYQGNSAEWMAIW